MSERSVAGSLVELAAAAAAENAGGPAFELPRKAAFARFAELGVPTRRHEEWKYTNAERIARGPWRLAPEASLAPDALDALDLALDDLPRLVCVNGRRAPALTRTPGVCAKSIDTVEPHEIAATEHLLPLPDALGDRAFAALTAALAPEVAAITVGGDGTTFVVVAFLAAPGEELLIPTRLAVDVEPGSHLALVELYAGPAGPDRQLHPALTEIRVGANASVDHLRIQLDGPGTTHLAHVHAHLARDARYTSRTVALGAAVSRLDLVATLDGEGAEAVLDGLYVAGEGQHHETRTTVDHARPHGTSRELYKGVLCGRSRGVFSGKVLVRKDAQKTSADQKNQNLLLGADAEVDSKPQLEIEADDVRCSHGSTIGQLEEEALFYLRARGLDAGAARALLVRAFVGEVLAGIGRAELGGRLLERALAKLAGAGVRAEAAS